MNTATDTAGGPCAVTFAERREIALREFLDGVDRYPADAAWALQRQLERIDRAEAAENERERLSLEAVKDNDAVARLAHAMRAKLTLTRQNRGGWWTENCTAESLSAMLRNCVRKGDPVDVANFCAFLVARGDRIVSGGDLTDVSAKAVEAVTKAECPSADTRTDYIGRLVPRSVPEEGPRSATERELQRTTVPVPGADVPAAYVVGAIEFAGELNKARLKFGPMASAHEGYAVIAEEFDELKAVVWQKQSERDYAALRKETIQLGAMVLAFLLEVVNPENRR